MKKRFIEKNDLLELYVNQNLGIIKISKITNISTRTLNKFLELYKIQKRPQNKFQDITGKKFGKLTVLRVGKKSSTKNTYYWVCKCECGKEKSIVKYALFSGKTKSCGFCSRPLTENPEGRYRGYKDLGQSYWSRIILRSINIKKPFNLTIEEAWNLYEKQNRKCALTGLDIVLTKNGVSDGTNTASLDRIDSSKGYVLNNVQWLHKDINRMKMDLKEDKLIEYCKLIIEINNDRNKKRRFNKNCK